MTVGAIVQQLSVRRVERRREDKGSTGCPGATPPSEAP